MPNQITISRQQAKLHKVSEAVGVFVTVPFFFYASKHLPSEQARRVAFVLGVGALAVDGLLLARFLSETTSKPLF